jgi:dTDP-4-amino-4,6-dideoxygalactose transaminase
VIDRYRIPFNRPTRSERDGLYIEQALAGGKLCGDGPFTARCHELLEGALGAPRVLLTTSCTHALEMSCLLANVAPGDEVIVPSFTFVSSANAFVIRGATPVFADIRPDTLNLDERQLASLITPRTRAIVVVHYAGVGCQMDVIQRIAAAHGVAIVEDNAHGLFGRFQGRPLGTFGVTSTLSFHETKNLTCGEGGALVINDRSLVERAEILREKGTDRTKFNRGLVAKYEWIDVGSSYLPSELLSAMLCAQLEARESIQAARESRWHRYAAALAGWARDNGVGLPVVPGDCEQSFHMFYLMMPSTEFRARVMAHLKARGILAVSHYVPLHLSPVGRRFGGDRVTCPVTERVAATLLRLPFYTQMTGDEQAEVIARIQECRA